jgi:hypothetical protein
LAGYGIKAIGSSLAQATLATTISANFTVGPSYRAGFYVNTGGTIIGTLPLIATLGSDFFFSVRNQGSGAITLTPSGGELIDSSANVVLQVNESCLVQAGTSGWYTVGRGRNQQFNFTQLTKTVTGGTNTLTLTEASNVVQKYIGVLVSPEVIVVPSVVQVYYVNNATSGAYSLTIKTAGVGTTLTIPTGQTAVVFCDGINVINASTSTTGLAALVMGAGSVSSPSLSFVDPSNGLFAPTSLSVGISTGGVEATRFITAQQLSANGTVSAPAFSFLASPGTGMSSPAVNELALSAGASQIVRVNAAGMNGVLGATTPASANVTTLGASGAVTALSFAGPLTGNVTGNATTSSTAGSAATLTTPRAINGVNFDGSAPITVTAAAGTLTGSTLASGVTTSSLTTVGALVGATVSADPSVALGIASKQYVDAVATGIVVHAASVTSTTAALATCTYSNGTAGVGATLTCNTNIVLGALGGYSPTTSDRVLIKDQADQLQNGIYTVTSLGSVGVSPWVLTRATDVDQAAVGEMAAGVITYIANGTLIGTQWSLTPIGVITIGTTALLWTQFSGAGSYTAGAGISIASNVISTAGAGSFSSISNITTGGMSLLTIGDGTTGAWSRINMRGNTTSYAWSMGVQDLVSGAWTLAPSTAVGGNTYTTPVLTVSSTGLAVTGTLSATGNSQAANFYGTTNNITYVVDLATNNGMQINGSGVAAPNTLNFYTGAVKQVTLDASGNLGLGATPSAWSTGKALEIGDYGNALWGVSSGSTFLLNNAHYNAGYLYSRTAAASYYQQNTGIHYWFIAPSGTAGTAITFTQAMTLDVSGNLTVPAAYSTTNAAAPNAYIDATGKIQRSLVTALAYPGAGIPNSTGSAWGTSYTTTGSGTVLALATSPTLVTPVLGTPTSGNLSACTADGTNAVGFKEVPQNSQSVAYQTVLADSGKHILHPSADTTPRTFTIPANGTVAYPIGTALTFVNQNAGGVVTIAITTDTMRLAGAGTTGSRTLTANGIATALKLTATEWLISGTGLT